MRSRIMWCRTLRPLVPSLALMILLSARIHAQQPTDRSARPVIRGRGREQSCRRRRGSQPELSPTTS